MIELTRIASHPARIDGSVLQPKVLQGMSRDALLEFPLPTESQPLRLADVFSVHLRTGAENQDQDQDVVCLRGDCSDIDNIGRGLDRGTLVLVGDAGNYFGALQTGGTLIATGSVGAFACSAMKQGTVWVGGNCGDRLAAALPGERAGMRGGDVLIAGNVGDRACERMRRGTVLIAGNVGGYLAPQMIAGTILAMGRVESCWGLGMKRGSLIFAREPECESAAMLTPVRELELSFLPLVWNHLRALQSSIAPIYESISGRPFQPIPIPTTRWVGRSIGDLSVAGRGEVLVLRRLTSNPSHESIVDSRELEEHS